MSNKGSLSNKMSYIDNDYYLQDYEGTPPKDEKDLTKLCRRASEAIDILTGYKLKQDDEITSDFILGQIKLATATVVEHYILNGGYQTTMGAKPSQSNFKLGTFSISDSSSNSGDSDGDVSIHAPNKAISILAPTGLLYTGVDIYE